jgi:hypothetical protein
MPRSSDDVDAVIVECLDLLIVYFSYLKTIAAFDRTWTRFDVHRWWVTLRVFENDLILRLCRLDDDDKTTHSLREALRSVRNEVPQQALREIDTQLKDYRQLINPLKTKARNYFLAHLNKHAEVPYDPQGGLEKPIAAVVNIVDAIVGELVPYALKVGSQEQSLDLRQELSGSSEPQVG